MQGQILGLVSLGLLVAIAASSTLPADYRKLTYKYDPNWSWADDMDFDSEGFDPFAHVSELEPMQKSDNSDGNIVDELARFDAPRPGILEHSHNVHNAPLAVGDGTLDIVVADEDETNEDPTIDSVDASADVAEQTSATNKKKKKKQKKKKTKAGDAFHLEYHLPNLVTKVQNFKIATGERENILRNMYFTGLAMNLKLKSQVASKILLRDEEKVFAPRNRPATVLSGLQKMFSQYPQRLAQRQQECLDNFEHLKRAAIEAQYQASGHQLTETQITSEIAALTNDELNGILKRTKNKAVADQKKILCSFLWAASTDVHFLGDLMVKAKNYIGSSMTDGERETLQSQIADLRQMSRQLIPLAQNVFGMVEDIIGGPVDDNDFSGI
ncbi:hypothetical protein H4R34_003736 [Dimargaris verticillata]|uniref:Uncharacterized protein n=1 Tax=Dimargaris verticillata TaxID=2761393 RepID=A0A9W8B1K7_9FUNG|nr:hypothetical protein H4R34_003736 [Dimargaris verticillata]